ncbi:type I-E CRISPR-associated protein Cas6/Cse3/CasE [Nocardiopsis ansamitocini]|uniref:Type I-E CRISPR-associated protein Cas6/Cse3/CasE n=1 Tax=Nocardiopsis ansamitocini TaxID=1670832 RepID=A0A9W6PAD8_9ACTN|nr:type I-E CRISPR-associated protein Cas6/Cse3/CasE [Nocardiopsis ansamitocini]GLU49912.1 type I-E CRISPR-associated protein Cas6/Cse3/CasE [Nocardiopsis ansamitocini]
MTWLTRITADLRNREVRADFRSAGELHRRLIRLVPGLGSAPLPDPRRRGGLLFRVDETRSGVQLLVQSTDRLKTDVLRGGYGDVQTRDLTPFLGRLEKGQAVRYRIVASPVSRLGKSEHNAERLGRDPGTPARAYTRPLRGAEADAWWADRAATNGLDLRSAASTGLDDARDDGTSTRRRGIKHPVVRFEGTAVIADAEAVRAAVLTGIGRGKSHGCGLLSLAFAEG